MEHFVSTVADPVNKPKGLPTATGHSKPGGGVTNIPHPKSGDREMISGRRLKKGEITHSYDLQPNESGEGWVPCLPGQVCDGIQLRVRPSNRPDPDYR
jgi:hypothetical protein